MFNQMLSASVFGVEGKAISVEVDISSGLPQINIVGLADLAVRESVERVRAAIKNSGFSFPMDRITVNLAPADLRKEGTAFDLAIAAGILAASGQLAGALFKDTLLIGELSLNGGLRPVPGVLAMIQQAKEKGIKRVLLPLGNCREAGWISGMELYGLSHLGRLRYADGAKTLRQVLSSCPEGDMNSEELAGAKSGATLIDRDSAQIGSHRDGSLAENGKENRESEGSAPPDFMSKPTASASNEDSDNFPDRRNIPDFSDIIGQQHAKRALLIAAAGRHNVLFSGPPGTGKTMMIRALPGILPRLDEQEALEVTKIYSVAGMLPNDARGLITCPPFRSPHHHVSIAGLIGGGSIPKPGEITLAHRGVLYLDELTEFPRSVLDMLRQPLESSVISISRAKATVTFPASIMLAASFNPCPCGYYGHEHNGIYCSCSSTAISRYRARLSGPLLDRIDLQLDVPRPRMLDRPQKGTSPDSARLRSIVEAARERQRLRNRKLGAICNSELGGSALRKAARMKPDAERLLEQAFLTLGISLRAYDRLLKLARTIADVENRENVESEHIAEAIQYRRPGAAAP